MHCPLHEDYKRSASINVETGVWFCQAGCGGGKVKELIDRRDEWVAVPDEAMSGSPSNSNGATKQVTDPMVAGWMQALQANDPELNKLMKRRGLSNDTILNHELGWDKKSEAYTIPIRGPEREIWNVRRYQLEPQGERRKIWSVKGMGVPTLYPVDVFKSRPEYIIICEGELDALITIQNGFPAITRTGAARVWNVAWNERFSDLVVYVCHDADEAGQKGNRKVARALRKMAKKVLVIKLPYRIREKHGKDLTDYFKRHTPDDFRKLLDSAQPVGMQTRTKVEDIDPRDVSVLDSFDAKMVGRPLRLTVTVKGRREPGYSVPKKVHLTCTQDAGQKCLVCPMNSAGGDAKLNIEPNDPVVLELADASKLQIHDIIRRRYGAMKCNKLEIEAMRHQAVEVLFARPSVDHVNGRMESGDYKNVKLTSVGRHNTMPNNTVQVVGALFPDPRRQMNEFQAWEVNPLETTLDDFKIDRTTRRMLRVFHPRGNQSPLHKIRDISNELAAHVTKIYGRDEMHALMDLVWHSALSFKFANKLETKGWLDALVIGDTRTGKSEAADRLDDHYGAGEIVSCESASFAGIVGGLQQYGSGREWSISWGVVPLNDRRLVVLDEVGGLQPEEIAQLSDVRSRGVAQLTKIQQERTMARTRLLWLGNPRNSRVADYTYGVQAIRPLIGNSEDIARFDIAMSVKAGEVSAEEINRRHVTKRLTYTSEACRILIQWVWSRKPDQIKWESGAQRLVFSAAKEIGGRYVEDPPLIQVANVRIKIARIAVAIAGRLFSSPDGEVLSVKKSHVEAAVRFLDHIYGLESFGYAERSRELLAERGKAVSKKKTVRKYLRGRQGLAKFLRGTGHFRRQDLEEVLDVTREEANSIISTLWESSMVKKEKGNVVIQPTLHELLREVK